MKLRCIGLFLFLVSLFSCGIEVYYYLPQVPQQNISRTFNTDAAIELPPIPSRYFYATGYAIFYRIYISDFETSSFQIDTPFLQQISPALAANFRAIEPSTDPANLASGAGVASMFATRNYFQLELEGEEIGNFLSTSGTIMEIRFPTAQGGTPVARFRNLTAGEFGPEIPLRRSSILDSPLPEGDPLFHNRAELNTPTGAAPTIGNRDVATRTVSPRHAYVSMYVVTAGGNPDTFQPIFSRPTHISIFRLPDWN